MPTDAVTRHQNALAAVGAAAVKEPDNSDVKARKAALPAKIEAEQSAAK
jgi:hypothetical protein